jgi:hypothetical protein
MSSKLLGVIAEDKSDVDTLKNIISNVLNNSSIKVKPKLGKGCGKIKRKCKSWANELKDMGCTRLIILCDCDNNDPHVLMEELKKSLGPAPISKHIISIPIQELEAWLLSDPNGLKVSLNLRYKPQIRGDLESIQSPKEFLGNVVKKYSAKKIKYVNTIYNDKIAKYIDVNEIYRKCNSFKPLFNFVKTELS